MSTSGCGWCTCPPCADPTPFVFNAANSPLLGMLRARRVPVALHMDGLEWRRSKWGPRGQAYCLRAEEHGVRTADALIADAPGIADYYRHQFDVPTEMIRYGAPILEDVPTAPLAELGLDSGRYHVVVARFEPENHVREIVEGYHRSDARLLGAVHDQDVLDALHAHAATYLHGHSVGGSNPLLLRAMGAGTPVIAYDVGFNRETLDEDAWFFAGAAEIPGALHAAESDPEAAVRRGARHRDRARAAFG